MTKTTEEVHGGELLAWASLHVVSIFHRPPGWLITWLDAEGGEFHTQWQGQTLAEALEACRKA